MSEPTNAELEQFRRQWQAEVSSRRRRESRSETAIGAGSSTGGSTAAASSSTRDKVPNLQAATARENNHEGWLDGGSYDFDDLEAREEARRLGTSGVGVHPESKKEPQTALEHFERAVEKEGQGNMQESLVHYRRAYKLDDQVDRAYRNKHYPPNKFASKPAHINPSNKSATVPNTAHHSLHGSKLTVPGLVASFAGVPIQATVPDVEGDPQRPCPLASVPHEILIGILSQLAVIDVATLMRMSRVCKHLAFVTLAEDGLWRRVCNESKFGFRDMKYDFALTHKWESLPRTLDEGLDLSFDNFDLSDSSSKPNLPLTLLPSLTPECPSYLENFHARPRIRFSGVYISTVNYVRAGMNNSNSVYWGNSPVHMVTYYRYLRFYRDGSAISLLTFFEPNDVVPLLHKNNLISARKQSKEPLPTGITATVSPGQVTASQGQGQAPAQPPTATVVMREARKARWRLSLPHAAGIDPDEAKKLEPEGNVYVELEGSAKAYTYHMQLALRSVKTSNVAKNSKLAWRSFWSYNTITDDWGEFMLRNERAYVFSRVKSWADA